MAFADQKGWVAFLDLLGTTAEVGSDSRKLFLDRYQTFMKAVVVTGSAYRMRGAPEVLMTEGEWNERHQRPHAELMASRTFSMSDSVVLAVPMHEFSRADLDLEFLDPIRDIVTEAWTLGLSIRGAVAYGRFLADWKHKLIQGTALVSAAKWEAEQDWAWISLHPETARSTSAARLGDSFVTARVPTKSGSRDTLAVDPGAFIGSTSFGAPLLLADLTYGSWRSSSEETIKTKCKNTLQWLDSREVGPGQLGSADASALSIGFVRSEIQVRIEADSVESLRRAVERAATRAQLLDVQMNPDGCFAVLRTIYSGSPHRMLDVWHDLRDANDDLGSLSYSLANTGVDLSPGQPGDIAMIGPPIRKRASDELIIGGLAGTLGGASEEALKGLLFHALQEGDQQTARRIFEILDGRLPTTARHALDRLVSRCLESKKRVPASGHELHQEFSGWWLDGEYWYNRSVLYDLLGEFGEMLRFAVIAAALKPSNADAWDQVGEALRQLGRPESASDWHAEALLMNPENPKYLLHAGQAFIDVQEFDRAIHALEKAIALRSGYWQAHLKMCWVRLALGEIESATLSLGNARRSGAPVDSLTLFACYISFRRGEYSAIAALVEDKWSRIQSHMMRQELSCFEIHSMIALGRSDEVMDVLRRRGVEQTAKHRLLIAQALLETHEPMQALEIAQAVLESGSCLEEAELVAELASRVADPIQRPLSSETTAKVRGVSLVLCGRTIEQAVRYGIQAAFRGT